jgi:carbonic anhydrase
MYLQPGTPDSLDALFTSLENGIYLCHHSQNGEVELNVRKLSVSEIEISVHSYCGSMRCSPGVLREYLESWTDNASSDIVNHCGHLRREVLKALPEGYLSAKLDFSRCKRSNISPVLYLTASYLTDHRR